MTSFDFVFSKNPANVSGKVLAKKRKKSPTKNNDDSKEDTPQKTRKVTTKPKPKFHFQKKPSQPPGNLIKRKHKKDKTLGIAPTADQGGSNKKDKNPHSLFSEKHKQKVISNVPGASIVEKVFTSQSSFDSVSIHKHIVSNLVKHGFNSLTNVQEKAIPVILKGDNVLIRSQTGSGKTLAYAVPIIEALHGITPRLERNAGLQALIVVPTRELALQTHEIISKICTFQWIVIGHLCGGENRNTEKNRLRKGTHILVATPGRLLDHVLHTASFKIDKVRCLVLDEADRLLDMGFKKDIIKIVEELDKAKEDLPETTQTDGGYCLGNLSSKKRQNLLLSATLTKGIAELAEFLMKDHTYVDALDQSVKINPDHMVIPKSVQQEYMITFVKHRLFTLASILLAKSKQNCKVLVFMATSQMVDFHHELLTNYFVRLPINRGKLKSGDVVLLDDGDEIDDEETVVDAQFFKLHGSMEQQKRKEQFTGFRKAKKGILLCTDVAARGIDVPQADFVIQYTGPQSDEDYLHRVGRTGRANQNGTALIFLTHEEQEYVTHLQKHKVFLKERNPSEFTKYLCDLMEEVDVERAAIALQRRFEGAVSEDKQLYKSACFAYSSWSRFYNSYPTKLRDIFSFQKVNLGHYVTSFAIKDTPSAVAKVVRGQVAHVEPKRLNKKLETHEGLDESKKPKRQAEKRKIKSISLTMSEYSSGIDIKKKKKKKQ